METDAAQNKTGSRGDGGDSREKYRTTETKAPRENNDRRRADVLELRAWLGLLARAR